MKTINLLPKKDQKEITLELITHQLINFSVWVIVSMLIFFLIEFTTETKLKQGITSTDNEITQNKAALKSAANQQLENQVLTLSNEIKLVQTVRQQHYYWSNALIELGDLIPADIVIDILSLDRATGKVEIAGTAADRESVLKFWSEIYKSKHFKNINFPLTNLEKSSDSPFNFTFYINSDEIKKE
jgi:Tfp pilus assembly protein PilN